MKKQKSKLNTLLDKVTSLAKEIKEEVTSKESGPPLIVKP